MLDSFPNLHPIVVHFPIALFVSAVLGDAALVIRVRAGWLDRALTLAYAAAAVASLAAAVTGKIAEPVAESLSEEAQAVVKAHGDWAFFSVVLCFVVAFLRFDLFWRSREREAIVVDRRRVAGFALSVVVCAVLIRTAAHGGALVFRHGVGVLVSEGVERGER